MSGAGAFGEQTMTIGMLMESAQTQQRLAQEQLTQLHAHTGQLDAVVRDEIRRTLIDELKMLHAEIVTAAHALRRLKRIVVWWPTLLLVPAALLSGLALIGIARWLLPSAAEVAALQVSRNQLSANLAALEAQGGRIELRHCGAKLRLCARVDSASVKYGQSGDYYVLHGY